MSEIKKELINNVAQYKKIKQAISEFQETLKETKADIIAMLKTMGLKKYNDGACSASFSEPISFDKKQFVKDHPIIAERYTTRKERIVEDVNFDRKAFEQDYPEKIKPYLKKQTPRLTVK